MQQKTVKHSVSCFGVGIHSGKPASLTIYPAPENSGIIFVRTDIKNQPNRVKAQYNYVSKTILGTTISNESGVEISIIEHLMAALWGCKIDNALIELDGPEIPIMDGSSESFVFMAECAGVKIQNATREYIEITKKIRIEYNDSFIELLPSECFSADTTIDFKDSIISKQTYSFSEKDSSIIFIIFYFCVTKHGHFTYLLGHMTDDTKLPFVSFCKTNCISPLIKLSSTPNAGTLL